MKNYLYIVCLGIISLSLAQSPDVMAKAAYLSAQEYYSNGDFETAIVKLNQTKKHLNGSNPKVDYLLTMCYAQMGQVQNARTAMKDYFDQAADSDPYYMEMMSMINQLEQLEKAPGSKMLTEEAFWKNAKEINNEEAYKEYLLKFPNEKYTVEAKRQLAETSSNSMTDPRDGITYKAVRIGNQLWMAEDLKYPPNNITSYCPDGWRVPSTEDALELLSALGLNYAPKWERAASTRTHARNQAMCYNDEVISSLCTSSNFGRIPSTSNSKKLSLQLYPYNFDYMIATILLSDGAMSVTWGSKNAITIFKITETLKITSLASQMENKSCRCIKD